MKKHFLTTLAAGLVACAAAPALAGEITLLTNRADAGPVQITFDGTGVALGGAFGSHYESSAGVRFNDLYADGEAAPGDGEYNGFAQYFNDSTVASNFSMEFRPGTGSYEGLSAGAIQSTTVYVDFLDPLNATQRQNMNVVGFDFLALPVNTVSMQLFSGIDGQTAVGTARTFQTALSDPGDPDSMPVVGFAGLMSTEGFNRVSIQISGSANAPAYFAMNDLRFGVAVVPLPPAAFMGLGLLAGIGIMRRLRRRSAG